MKYKAIIKKMTLEEKASLMSGKDFWQTRGIEKYEIPTIFLADGPNGLRKQKADADHLGLNESIKSTCFPTSATIANSWDPSLVEKMASYLGDEAVAENVGVILGPGTNIKRNPLGGRNFEYYSEDPYLAGKLSAGFIRGVQSKGVATTVKHYAVNNQELRRMSIDSVVDERALREIYLTPFEISVKEGKSKAIMASYNLVNGVYANESKHLLQEILRDEWKFNGVIVSDWGGINDRVLALKASCELEMPHSGGYTNQEIIDAVNQGMLDENILDQAVDRLLTLIFESHKVVNKNTKKFDIDLHHDIAKEVAEESIVMLKNIDETLPLKEKCKVAFIGDFAKNQRYQGSGSSGVNPTKLSSILDEKDKFLFDFIGYEQGFHRYGKKGHRLAKKAIDLVRKADTVVLFLGLDEFSETEGLDRQSIDLPKNQIDLLHDISSFNPNIVVVLTCGSVIDMSWDDKAKSIIHGYLPGQGGAQAILNVLSGIVNPSGKLAETYPVHYQDTSSASYFPGLENTVEYRESIFVGYRYFLTADVKVKYSFGYGLSYTTFKYGSLKIESDSVSFSIKNTGKTDGKEIAQLYIEKSDSKILRPKKELKGFAKIHLKAGETKQINILFDEYTFRFFNTKTNQWEVEPGKYDIHIGSSSIDIHLNGSIDIEGTKFKYPYQLSDVGDYTSMHIDNISDDHFKVLLERDIPDSKFVFYKKNRMLVDYNTTVQQLRYAKGWSGRFFSWSIRFGYKFMRFIGARKIANIMQMALYHNPMRNMSRLTGGAITWKQLDGLILMFNGKFFKGFKMFIKSRKKKQRKVKA